jgi:GxxExxY protein
MVQVPTDKPHWQLTEKIIGAAFEVHQNLGQGFLESVYVNALMQELSVKGLKAQTERPIPVSYKGVEIGIYYADVIVEDAVICEIKAVKSLLPEHQAQLINYLKATRIEVGLLLNFGARVEHKRMVLRPPKPS